MEIVMSEMDAARLIHALYKGRWPKHVHTLICGCSAQADLRRDPVAWNGWRVLPTAKCPECLAQRQLVEWSLVPHEARVRFLALVDRVSVR